MVECYKIANSMDHTICNQQPTGRQEEMIDYGQLAGHVSGALGSLKGYGHEDTAAAQSLQFVLGQLMKAYEAAKQQPAAPVGDDVERVARAIAGEMGCAHETDTTFWECRRKEAKAALAAMPNPTPLIRQLVDALNAMVSEAKDRNCGLRCADEALAAGQAYRQQEGNP